MNFLNIFHLLYYSFGCFVNKATQTFSSISKPLQDCGQVCLGPDRPTLITLWNLKNLICLRSTIIWVTNKVVTYTGIFGPRQRQHYQTGRHRTVVYGHLPSQAGVNFIKILPNSITTTPTPKTLKTRLQIFLASKAFYSVDGFSAENWENAV